MKIACIAAVAAITALTCGCASTSAPDTQAAATGIAEPPTAAVASNVSEYKPPAGYKKRMLNGQTVYCSKIVVLGSRFPKEDCRSQGELEDLERQRAAMQSDIERQKAVCASAPGCVFR